MFYKIFISLVCVLSIFILPTPVFASDLYFNPDSIHIVPDPPVEEVPARVYIQVHSDLPDDTTAKVRVSADGKIIDEDLPIFIAKMQDMLEDWAYFDYKFKDSGEYQFTFELYDISPPDDNATNNTLQKTVTVDLDTDGDEIGDTTDDDDDNDGLTDQRERSIGTNPILADTDSDSVNDRLDYFPTNPAESRDTDRDGMGDNFERSHSLNPQDPADAEIDPDTDGLTNIQEYRHHTSINNPDTDSDGLSDGYEVAYSLNPSNPRDASSDRDHDGLTVLVEHARGTNPTIADTDHDGVADGEDAFALDITYQKDSDQDGLPDKYEVKNNLNPYLAKDANMDFDNDGLSNSVEFTQHTDPLSADSDSDGLTDGTELTLDYNPLQQDSNANGISDRKEYLSARNKKIIPIILSILSLIIITWSMFKIFTNKARKK